MSLKKVTEPTEWVNSLVVVEKPNKSVRLCLDPRELNKRILRQHLPMKTAEEVAAKVKNAKVYSVLDASNGYWQMRLTKDNQKYTCSTLLLEDINICIYHLVSKAQVRFFKGKSLKY